jgi:translocator protein
VCLLTKMNLIAFAFVLTPVFFGFVSGRISGSAGDSDYYKTVPKAPWNPPSWVFGPVWTSLYVMMGAASFMIWKAGETSFTPTVAIALVLYTVQLSINLAWSPVFFAWQRPDIALVIIVLLWFMITATIASFAAISKTAALLLSPYLVWVTYAISLNAYVVMHMTQNKNNRIAKPAYEYMLYHERSQ